MRLILSKKIQESEDVFTFVFEPQKHVSWTAGQYMYWTLKHKDSDNRGESRYFTISSAPHEKMIMLTTRFARENGSTFKKALQELPIGSTIDTFPPDGDFVVKDPKEKAVLIAGGIGITPFRSILLDCDYRGEVPPSILLYANRTSDIVFKNVFDDIAKKNPQFIPHYIVDPEKINAETIQKYVPDMGEYVYYISGPKPMVDAIKNTLESLGIKGKKIKTDYFPGYFQF